MGLDLGETWGGGLLSGQNGTGCIGYLGQKKLFRLTLRWVVSKGLIWRHPLNAMLEINVVKFMGVDVQVVLGRRYHDW